MPLIPIAIALLLPFVLVLALPLSLMQRYRVGTARRPARRWLAAINLILIIFSAVVFIWAAALTNLWLPKAFAYALLGFTSGGLLGLVGLALTQWERTTRGLHYTPNRWLVLFLTAIVTARIFYSFWRGWHVWAAGDRGASWLAQSGAAGALGVGAIVLGHYVVYAAGIYRRIKREERG